ncbi:MAG: hypothetical protein QM625_08935 [Ralstonia sp.]|uniref:hypothetical protein n=1 Tax=Ralstonia TaxID=48736 RepID=UPI0015F8F554|nr:hypothetical protein [Ralstonia pickettii]
MVALALESTCTIHQRAKADDEVTWRPIFNRSKPEVVPCLDQSVSASINALRVHSFSAFALFCDGKAFPSNYKFLA